MQSPFLAKNIRYHLRWWETFYFQNFYLTPYHFKFLETRANIQLDGLKKSFFEGIKKTWS